MTAPRFSTNRTKTLVIVRHAHRNKDKGRSADNGLSLKGHLQTKWIRLFFKRVYSDQKLAEQKIIVYSSPKQRCIETVEGVAKRYGTRVEIFPLLDEQLEAENPVSFRKRIDRFIRWWQEEAPEFCVVCSHGDWIPLFLQKATGVVGKVGKGGIIELAIEKSKNTSIVWFLPHIEVIRKPQQTEY